MEAPRPDMTQRPFIPKDWRFLLWVILALVVIPITLGNDYFLLLFNVMAINALVVLGLNLLIGSTGQVSLGHAAFFGIGAYLSAIASTTWQWPLICSLLFSLTAVGIVGCLLAIPTLKLEGHYLVMATLGFNIIVSILLEQMDSITGGPSGFPGIPQLRFGSFVIDSDFKFYAFIWPLLLVLFALTLNLNDSRIGRAFKAIHEKELTAEAMGIASHKYKVAVFVLSTLYAGLAGFCYAHYVTFISPKTFDIFYSVQVVTMVVVGGMGSLWGGLAGAALLTAMPEVLHQFEDWYVLIYGLILMSVLVFLPKGLLPALSAIPRGRQRKASRSRPSPVDHAKPGDGPASHFFRQQPERSAMALSGKHREPPSTRPALQLRGVSLSFGGLQALTNIEMDVRAGEIVALIGPNGAGKTTVLNIISGLLRPNEGDVLLNGKSLLGSAPHAIASLGVGRTFQTVQVYQAFSVLENALLGYHTAGNTGFLSAYLHLGRERREETRLRQTALQLLDDFDLADKAGAPIEQLSLVEKKLLELARALALAPSVLLLDEPVGGLNPRESAILVSYLRHLREHGMGTLLVEHDMNVVMSLADRVVVLQHGNQIAVGTPRQVQADPRVIAAYLGKKSGDKQRMEP
jgi:branched-chain amino acid transport system permease protein